MKALSLEVRGMSCGHCVSSVSNALQALDGVEVEEVKIGSARVKYDPDKVTPDALRDAVADAGYEVTPVIPSDSEGSAHGTADSPLHPD